MEEKPKKVLRQGTQYEEGNAEAKPKPKPKPRPNPEKGPVPTQKKAPKVVGKSKEAPKVPIKLVIGAGAALVVALVCIYFFTDVFKKEDLDLDVAELDAELEDGVLDGVITEEIEFGLVYTDEEWELLRGEGFTDEQIMQFEIEQRLPDDIITEAQEKLDTDLKSRYAELIDEAKTAGSPEYNDLLNKTWLGLPPRNLQGDPEGLYDTYQLTENVTYTKLGYRGSQAFLKLDSNEYGPLYHTVDYASYLKLRDTGSIVITYIVAKVNGAEVVQDITTEIVDSIPDME